TCRYNRNRDLIQRVDAPGLTHDGSSHRTTFLYDGFDRIVSIVDALGNQTFTQYDPAGNAVRISRFGPLTTSGVDDDSGATFRQPLRLDTFEQSLLSQVEQKYDERHRRFEKNERLFVHEESRCLRPVVLKDGPLGRSDDRWVTTRYEHDKLGRQTFTIADDL